MGLDEFQLFDERRKRKPLGDATNTYRLLSNENEARLTRSKKIALFVKYPSVRAFGIHEQAVSKALKAAWPRSVRPTSKNASPPEVMRIFSKAKVKEDGGSDVGRRESLGLLLLNIRNVVADTSFKEQKDLSKSYFEFVHSLTGCNDVTRQSILVVKKFASRQKLRQLLSPQQCPQIGEFTVSKTRKEVTVTNATPVSAFMTAISSYEAEDCLLLNTAGNHSLKGQKLVLGKFQVHNLLGKNIRFYKEWSTK